GAAESTRHERKTPATNTAPAARTGSAPSRMRRVTPRYPPGVCGRRAGVLLFGYCFRAGLRPSQGPKECDLPRIFWAQRPVESGKSGKSGEGLAGLTVGAGAVR